MAHIDDVLIFGCTQQEHNTRLHIALQKIQSVRVTLNKEKCEFSRDISGTCYQPRGRDTRSPQNLCNCSSGKANHPYRTAEIHGYDRLTWEVLHQRLQRFHSHYVSYLAPWLWGLPQDEVFEKLKTELTQSTVFALYNPEPLLRSQ